VVGIVADFGGYANTRVNDRLFSYMFGPRFNWRHARLSPYVQFLVGGAYVWNDLDTVSTTQNAFAFAAGGGVDYHLTKHISLKPLQVEYVMTQIASTKGFGSYQNDIRYSGGVTFRFGAK
jgi:opacity protein-like surface antigen